MKRLSILFVAIIAALLSPVSHAQNLGADSGFCDQGGKHALTAALPSTNFLQGIIPSCTVTVFLSGTQTTAPIFADSAGHVLDNPFTANNAQSASPGQWTFWSDPTKPVDIVLSGGIPPNTYATPVTLTDQSPSSAGAFVPLAGGTMYGTLFTPNINGEVYPAACGRSPAPNWCTGSTADAWIRAACTQLPAIGGTINLLGLNGTLSASVPCGSPDQQIIFRFDPASTLTVTEADGGIVFPLDNNSMFVGPPGAGQCRQNIGGSGIRLASTANITSVVGPAHTDGSQEDFTAQGLCIEGAAGATVSKGLIYDKATFVNTTISNNNLAVCNTSCLWMENVGGMVEVYNNEFDVTAGVYSIQGSGINLVSSATAGCENTSVNIHGGNSEHANGGDNFPEINIHGNGAGAEPCAVYVHDIYTERNSTAGSTPSTTAIRIQDCFGCSFTNVQAGGGAPGAGGDMINISQTAIGRVQNVTFNNINNILGGGSWANTINDTTPGGQVLSSIGVPYVATYFSNPGYQQSPALPQNTIQALGSDLMNGQGAMATGDGNFGTNFQAYGCQPEQGITCTYTRTNSTAPPGFTFSQQVQITANTDPSGGDNGIEFSPAITFTAGATYQVTFWMKGDGTFGGLPLFILGDPNVPTQYCAYEAPAALTTTWKLFTVTCTPSGSGASFLAFSTVASPLFATGTFWIAGMTFAPVIPFPPTSALLGSVGPYGVGPVSLTTTGTSGPSTYANGVLNIPQYSGGGGAGVSSINTVTGPFTFSFSDGAGNCTGTTCTFTGSGSGGGSVTNFIANTGDWPTWLTPSVATSTTIPTLSVAASAIPNSALANPGLTLGSTPLTLGATTTNVSGLTLASPILTTPNLGTPSAVNLANATNLPWTAITGTPSTSQVPFQSLTTTGSSGPATLVAGVLNVPQYTGGTGGGGTVASCSLANQLSAYLTAGSTVNCQPGLFSATPTMTSAQLTTLFSSAGSGTVMIPGGTPQIGFNPSTVLSGFDWRPGAFPVQLGLLGVADDAKQWNLTLTAGSNQVNVGADFGTEAIGKSFWVSSGGNYGTTQQTWLATISAYSFPNATLSANAPFNYSGNVWVGTDNTTRFQAALNGVGSKYNLLVPSGGAIMTQTLLLNNSQSIIGMGSGNTGSVIVGPPGGDVFQGPDSSGGGSDSGAGMRIEHLHLIVDSGVNAAWGYTAYNANGVPTTVPPVYRPLYEKTVKANNPCGPGWAQNCFQGIASITQNTGAICVLTPTGPTVSNQIVFPDLPVAFVATVSSVGGSCTGGTTYNISPAFPNTSGYTVAQAEWYSTSSVQTSTTAITGTYPLTIHLANSIAPVPGFESNVAPSGRIKDSAGQSFMYYGDSYSAQTITLTAGPSSCTGADCSTGFAIVPRNPCAADFNTPSPYTPTLNSGDSTPSGANFFAGDCAGAAGIAYPTANGNVFVGTGPSQARIVDVDVQPSLAQLIHGSTGFYFGGNKTGYHTLWDGLRTDYTEFSFVQGPASYGQHGVAAVGPTSNGNQLANCEFYSAKAIALVSWQGSPINQCDFYSTEINPYDGTANGAAAGFYMSPTYDEQNGSIVTSVTTSAVRGVTGEPENGTHAAIPPFAGIDCFQCTFEGNNFEGGYNVVGGSGNTFKNTQLGLPVVDYGSRNTFDQQTALSGRIGLAWGAPWLNWGQNESCDGFSSGGLGSLTNCGAGDAQPFHGKSMESDSRGVTANPSPNDLAAQIKPAQWNNNGAFDAAPMTTINNVDATETYWGRNATCALGGGAQCSTEHFPTDYIQIAPFNPITPTPYLYAAEFKSSNGSLTTFNMKIGAFDQGDGQCASAGQFYSTTVTVGTSWTPWADRVDFSSHTGCILQIQFGSGNATGTLSVGYFNFLQASKLVHAPTGTLTAGAACAAGSVLGDILSDDATSIYWCGPSSTIVASGSGGSGGLPAGTGMVKVVAGAGNLATSGADFFSPVTAAGIYQAPVSTGAGNTYAAANIPVSFGTAQDQFIQQSVTNANYTTLNVNSLNDEIWVEGFAGGPYTGIGQAQVAWASGPNYALCQNVSQGGNNYVAVTAANGAITPGTNAAIWWPKATSDPTTQADCAFATTAAYAQSRSKQITLRAGSGNWNMTGWIEPAGLYSVNVIGTGSASFATNWNFTGTAAVPMIQRATGGSFTFMTIAHAQWTPNKIASSVMDLGALNQSNFFDMAWSEPAPGSTFFARWGEFGGDAFQVHAYDIIAGTNTGQKVNNLASLTANVVGGSITSYTVNSGGTGTPYPAADSTHLYWVQVNGYQGGTAKQPCTVMPTGQAVTVSAGLVTAVSEGSNSGGSGCSGTIDVSVYTYYPVQYGIDLNISDSNMDNVTCYAGSPLGACLGGLAGDTNFKGIHPSYIANGIVTICDADVYVGTELDNVLNQGFQFTQPFAHPGCSVVGTHAYGVIPGSTPYYFASAGSNVAISDNASLCNTTPPADWHEFVTQSGTIDTAADYLTKSPSGLRVIGNDTSCGQAMGDFIPTATVRTLTGSGGLAIDGGGNVTTNGKISPAASTTAHAPANLGSGTAPTSPVNGDIWITSAGMYAQVAGSTIGPFAATGITAGVSSFNTRTGAVVPVSGDYTVSQVTGAAPLASPTFTGTPAAPTAAFGTNTTQLATTAFVQADVPANAETVASSATPTFSTSFITSYTVLTSNVTTFTLASGTDGQIKNLCFKQGASGFTVTPPANVHGFFTVGLTANLYSCQPFVFNGANSIWLATAPGVVNM